MEKVAEIYQKNTGTTIEPQELQKAFTEAGASLRAEAMDQFLQKLVEEGKITQEQADAWKTWLAARPDKALTDEFKAWMDSHPDIPGIFGSDDSTMMPFGRHIFGFNGLKMGPGPRGCFPGTND
jgi:hypothetical protein